MLVSRLIKGLFVFSELYIYKCVANESTIFD